MDEPEQTEGALFETRVGVTLRDARLSHNIELRDIASETRVPLRHLEAIESGEYDRLPAPTYSTGFVKAFAREVGLDPEAIGRAFREEIAFHSPSVRRDYFEATDPARVPPRGLAWTAAAIAIVLLLAYGIWRSGWFGEDADDRARLA
ncbi:MAG: helix-turn-helix domain-containing protein, partial [Sphingomonadaceae bacterium]|nr:helix-turn-helix domain-containing protein [Sphingomonadaceae bacterium]